MTRRASSERSTRAPIPTRRTGYSRILDYHELPNYDRIGKVMVSTRLRELLVAGGHAFGLEFFPIEVRNHAGAALDGYWLLYAPRHDCIDEEKSKPVYRFDDDYSEVRRLVVDEAKVPHAAQAFRPLRYATPLMVRPALAAALTKALEAKALEGFVLRLPRR